MGSHLPEGTGCGDGKGSHGEGMVGAVRDLVCARAPSRRCYFHEHARKRLLGLRTDIKEPARSSALIPRALPRRPVYALTPQPPSDISLPLPPPLLKCLQKIYPTSLSLHSSTFPRRRSSFAPDVTLRSLQISTRLQQRPITTTAPTPATATASSSAALAETGLLPGAIGLGMLLPGTASSVVLQRMASTRQTSPPRLPPQSATHSMTIKIWMPPPPLYRLCTSGRSPPLLPTSPLTLLLSPPPQSPPNSPSTARHRPLPYLPAPSEHPLLSCNPALPLPLPRQSIPSSPTLLLTLS